MARRGFSLFLFGLLFTVVVLSGSRADMVRRSFATEVNFDFKNLVPNLCPNCPPQEQGSLYLLSNERVKNSIIVYDRYTDGSLVYAGKYMTGGSGPDFVTPQETLQNAPYLMPLGSANPLILTPGEKTLLCANAGSNDITAFDVQPHGGLVNVGRWSSGGVYPSSLVLNKAGTLLYVLNKGDASNSASVAAFKVQGNQLTLLAGIVTPILPHSVFLNS